MGTKSFSHGLGKSMVVGVIIPKKKISKLCHFLRGQSNIFNSFHWAAACITFVCPKPKLFHVVGNFCLFMYLFCIPTYFGLHSKVHIIHSPKVAMIIAYTIFLFKFPLMLLIASSFLLLIMFIYELVELFSSFSYLGNLLFGLLPIGLCHTLCDDESLWCMKHDIDGKDSTIRAILQLTSNINFSYAFFINSRIQIPIIESHFKHTLFWVHVYFPLKKCLFYLAKTRSKLFFIFTKF